MARRRGQRGTLRAVKNIHGYSTWVGRYRLYDSRGGKGQQRVYLGMTHEVTEDQAREKLLTMIERSNKNAGDVRHMGTEEILRHEVSFKGNPTRYLMGSISELMVAADLMSKGYEVFRGLCAQASCDLITSKDGEFQRIEVKTEGPGNIRDIKRNVGKFDIAAIFSKSTGKITYIPVYEIRSMKIARRVREI